MTLFMTPRTLADASSRIDSKETSNPNSQKIINYPDERPQIKRTIAMPKIEENELSNSMPSTSGITRCCVKTPKILRKSMMNVTI